jgi:hypothetical protein
MKSPNSFQVNQTEAIKFLNNLSGNPNESFVFQTFDDNQKEGAQKRHELTKVITGTFAEHAETLTKLNQAGAGVFVQINIADGNGRKAANITSLRAVFIDKDDGDIGEMKIKPSILVQTKHGQHAFWKLAPGEPLETFKITQKALIHHLRTDKSVHNLDRTMRLPGFIHQKDPADPFIVTVREVNDATFKIGDILAAYPTPETVRNRKVIKKVKTSGSDEDKKLTKFKKWVGRQSAAEGGRNATVVKIVREGLGHDIEETSLREIIEDYCENSGLPVEEGIKVLDRHILEHEAKGFEPYQNLSERYEVMDGRIHWNKPTQDGSTPVALCSFDAKIVKEEIHDDGADTKSYFQIEGKTFDGKPLSKISVTAEEFSSLNWVTAKWGQKAYVYARSSEHLRVAIQELSGSAEQLSIYKHTGWRKVDDRYLYLHGNGAIGTNGPDASVQVDLKSGRLNDYFLPTPPIGEELKKSFKASLSLLEAAPKHIAFTLLATVYRSVLAECHPVDYSIFVSGPTGCFKSSVIGVVQAHFGSQFKFGRLPDNWTSTENSLEKKSFLLKDCIFTIDEWTANGTNAEADRLRAKAERILRSQGNQAGRGRMSSNLDMRAEYYPRGIIISTGEDMPPGQSLRARSIQIEMSHGDVDKLKLTRLQDDAANGLLVQSTAAYIQWLAPQIDKLKKRVPKLQRKLRDNIRKASMHNRTPDTTASLLVGLRMFLKFGLSRGAITKSQMNTLWNEGKLSLLELAEKQSGHQSTEDHANKFVSYVKYALNMGEAYIVNAKSGEVASEFGRHNSQSRKIGWVDGSEVFLDPDAAFALVQQIAKNQNEAIPISKNTLWKRLVQKGIASPSDTEQRNTVKKTVEGRRSYVLAFADKGLFLEKEEKSKPHATSTNGVHPASGEVS